MLSYRFGQKLHFHFFLFDLYDFLYFYFYIARVLYRKIEVLYAYKIHYTTSISNTALKFSNKCAMSDPSIDQMKRILSEGKWARVFIGPAESQMGDEEYTLVQFGNAYWWWLPHHCDYSTTLWTGVHDPRSNNEVFRVYFPDDSDYEYDFDGDDDVIDFDDDGKDSLKCVTFDDPVNDFIKNLEIEVCYLIGDMVSRNVDLEKPFDSTISTATKVCLRDFFREIRHKNCWKLVIPVGELMPDSFTKLVRKSYTH